MPDSRANGSQNGMRELEKNMSKNGHSQKSVTAPTTQEHSSSGETRKATTAVANEKDSSGVLSKKIQQQQQEQRGRQQRSDEHVEYFKQGSASAKAQRSPPSPLKPSYTRDDSLGTPEASMAGTRSVMADTFDWLGEKHYYPVDTTIKPSSTARGSSLKDVRREIKYRNSPVGNQRNSNHPWQNDESSSFLLFTQSFDTISEGAEYLQDLHQQETFDGGNASPLGTNGRYQQNLATAGMEIALPKLNHNHSGSDCSLGDVSPIKVATRQTMRASTMPPTPDPGNSYWLSPPNPYPPYPPRHIMQTYASRSPHMGIPVAAPHPSPFPAPNMPTRRHAEHDDYCWRQHGHPGDEHVSNPFFVIRSCQRAFLGYTYLLPCLRDHEITVNLNRYGHIRRYQGKAEGLMDTNSIDLVIAIRRIETAICAFGGSLNVLRRPTHTSSIFRLKGSGSTRHQYEQQLSQRYRLGEGRLSWEVEANPPISLEHNDIDNGSKGTSAKSGRAKNSPHLIVDETPGRKRSADGLSSPTHSTGSFDNADAPKIKYRCKLCGQPKQNHNCTFRQSLQRSIGVQVFSAVNAYTACEPGTLAPALSKMNNFVSYDLSGSSNSNPPGEEQQGYHSSQLQCHPSTVTPQTTRDGGAEIHSPQSSLSTHSQEMSPDGGVPGGSSNPHAATRSGYQVQFAPRRHNVPTTNGDRKRSHSQFMESQGQPRPPFPGQPHMVFCPSVSLRPEHYRAVTPSNCAESTKPDLHRNGGTGSNLSYQYPPVPLTFAERKRLSDTLFCLCKEIPCMTTDCAAVLREARDKNDWDQAVAELLAQVVVGLYCGEGDSQLDGLQQYLLTLGVSC